MPPLHCSALPTLMEARREGRGVGDGRMEAQVNVEEKCREGEVREIEMGK